MYIHNTFFKSKVVISWSEIKLSICDFEKKSIRSNKQINFKILGVFT